MNDTKAVRSMITDIFWRNSVPMETKKACGRDHFEDVVITIGGRQHYIYSEEAMLFRKHCFYKRVNVDVSTRTYILDALHERNWETVTKTDRYKIL